MGALGYSSNNDDGKKYEELHRKAYTAAFAKLRKGGRFVLNVKNFIKDGEVVDVTDWHVAALKSIGFIEGTHKKVKTPGNRQGANGNKRVDHESVIVFFKLTYTVEALAAQTIEKC